MSPAILELPTMPVHIYFATAKHAKNMKKKMKKKPGTYFVQINNPVITFYQMIMIFWELN